MTTFTASNDALHAQRQRIRHSAAHVLADAVLSFFPDAKLTHGPPTEEGFYYDIDLPRPLTPEDLQSIEAKMREVIAADAPFVCTEMSREEAKQQFAGNAYKLETIGDIPEGERITTYSHGAFTDLCEGPHAQRAGEIKAFKLLSVAGAYWRGDEHNAMLQRIYGTAFESKEALEQHLKMLEEAAKRDHRKLGRELEFFMFDPVAPASPFFLPKGATVYNELVQYVRGINAKHGYEEVITPQIFSTDLWKRSGHYENYFENMFLVDVDEREFGIKPMNCPSHAIMYASQLHSYRELPVRYADFARLHRYERSGVTHGLTRVRSFAQDDAHLFCRPDQIQQEITVFLTQFAETYQMFGFGEISIRLSLRPEKRVGTDAMWDAAEAALESALQSNGLAFATAPGEGAFYGPKLDFLVKDAIGREWQMGTLQLDYSLPERFNLEYVTEDGSKDRPIVIHRAWLGSIERFMGILIEHTAGALPLWLAPVQAVVIPIADRHIPYAEQVRRELAAAGLRVKVDGRGERMNLKIREAQVHKTPYMLVVGDKEEEQLAVAVRLRSGENLGARPVVEVAEEMKQMARERR